MNETLWIKYDPRSRQRFAQRISNNAKWSIDEIANLFADTLEDANAHTEAGEIRRWIAAGCPQDGLVFVQR